MPAVSTLRPSGRLCGRSEPVTAGPSSGSPVRKRSYPVGRDETPNVSTADPGGLVSPEYRLPDSGEASRTARRQARRAGARPSVALSISTHDGGHRKLRLEAPRNLPAIFGRETTKRGLFVGANRPRIERALRRTFADATTSLVQAGSSESVQGAARTRVASPGRSPSNRARASTVRSSGTGNVPGASGPRR